MQGLLGASPDGSYVYFAANGVLAAGAEAGDCDTSSGNLTGECNLYLRHAGNTTLVARLGANEADSKYSDADNWAPEPPGTSAATNYEKTARVAADGTLLFSSTLSQTGYENEGVGSVGCGAGPCAELYRYLPGEAAVSCVSCSPVGALAARQRDGGQQPEGGGRRVADGRQVLGADPQPRIRREPRLLRDPRPAGRVRHQRGRRLRAAVGEPARLPGRL